jgi:hypothetical protein
MKRKLEAKQTKKRKRKLKRSEEKTARKLNREIHIVKERKKNKKGLSRRLSHVKTMIKDRITALEHLKDNEGMLDYIEWLEADKKIYESEEAKLKKQLTKKLEKKAAKPYSNVWHDVFYDSGDLRNNCGYRKRALYYQRLYNTNEFHYKSDGILNKLKEEDKTNGKKRIDPLREKREDRLRAGGCQRKKERGWKRKNYDIWRGRNKAA